MNSKSLGNVAGVVAMVAAEVRGYMVAVSNHSEGMCLRHAQIGQQLLRDQSIETRLVIGEAAWRVGDRDHEVLAHVKNVKGYGTGVMFHTWLEHGEYIIDFTTYTLPRKAALMDSFDGMRTEVSWCPEYLFVRKSSVSPYPAVRDKCAGLYYYRRDSALESRLLSRISGPDTTGDAGGLKVIFVS